MARTIQTIQTELNRRKFPCGILDDDDMQGVIDAALREFDRISPLIVFASFTTLFEVQDYFVFDPNDDATKTGTALPGNIALCADALEVQEVYWNPGGDWSSLNLFSPGWQLLSQMVLFTGSYFHQPSQLVILRQKLDTWKRQFGSQGFDVYGEPGDPTAFIRIYPQPEEPDGKVIVQYTKGHTLDSIGPSYERYFQMHIEYFYCEALANYFSQTSGIDLLGFKSSSDALKYWQSRCQQIQRRIDHIQLGPHGDVERS